MTRPRKTPRPVLSAERLEDRTTPAGFAPDRVLLTYATGTGADAMPLSGTPLGAGVFRVDLPAGSDVVAAAGGFVTAPGVTAAAPDAVLEVERVPNDSGYAGQWAAAKISAPAAWDRLTGTRNTIVAVIDTGVDITHPDLAANVWTNPREIPGNGIDDDGNGFVDDSRGYNFAANNADVSDSGTHGTHVSGILGAVGNNGVGVAGVNWNTRIMPLKFIGPAGGYTSDAVRAIQYAVANGAKVINESWGGDANDAALSAAIGSARAAGVIVVSAAGNSGRNLDNSPFYPGSYAATYDNAVTVAATDSTDSLASFSNFGSAVALAAPGVGISSTLPGNRYGSLSGTSMATPFVAGAIALLWDQNPTWDYHQILARLRQTVDVVPGLAGRVSTGGRLNVGRLLGASTSPPPPADTAGPRVTTFAFAGPSAAAFDRVRLTFSEAIQTSTFTTADIGLTGPAGAISATAVVAVGGSGNTQFDVTFPARTRAGNYTVTAGPDIRDVANNAMDQNANGTPGQVPGDRFTGTGTLTAAPTVPPAPTPSSRAGFSSGNIPLAVPDRGTARVWITVNADITIGDLDVRVDVTHTYDSDLKFTLTSPAGTVITLANRRGGSGDNFTGTTFDDGAATGIATAAAPFAGTFRPENALAAFNGQNARGQWTLAVQDLSGGNTGRVTAATLSIAAPAGTTSVVAAGWDDARPDAIVPALRPETRRLLGGG